MKTIKMSVLSKIKICKLRIFEAEELEWDKSTNVYGFIKNEKGLIYVAKMNDYRELELIK